MEKAEILENLARADLKKLERTQHLGRLQEIYEHEHPDERPEELRKAELKRGNNQARSAGTASREKPTKGFVKKAAEETGLSKRVVQESTQIARNIAPDVQEALKDTPSADSQKDLLKVARMPGGRALAVLQAPASGNQLKTTSSALGGGRALAVLQAPASLQAAIDSPKRLSRCIAFASGSRELSIYTLANGAARTKETSIQDYFLDL